MKFFRRNKNKKKQQQTSSPILSKTAAVVDYLSSSSRRHHYDDDDDDVDHHHKDSGPKGRLLGSGFFDGYTISWHYNSSSNSTVSPNHSYKTASSKKKSTTFLRHSSSFLRVADLCLGNGSECWSRCRHLSSSSSQDSGGSSVASTVTTAAADDAASCISCTADNVVVSPPETTTTNATNETYGAKIVDNDISESEVFAANFSYAAVDPPPGVEHDPNEKWIALDDGEGAHSPMAPLAVNALAQVGYKNCVLNQDMWTPHSPKQLKTCSWHTHTWQHQDSQQDTTTSSDGILLGELSSMSKKEEETVILWTGKFHHGLYGSDLPAVRAAGIIHVKPRTLFDLLVDSNRVQEYNKLSLGRDDLLMLQNDLNQEGPFGKSITKVMRSRSQPPLLSKTMEFVSILHAKELEDGSGYLLVTRAVTHPSSSDPSGGSSSSSVLQSEILMGVNVLRKVQGDPNRCLLISVNHIRSPMVPMMIAKRIGATAAAGFVNDLRTATANMQ